MHPQSEKGCRRLSRFSQIHAQSEEEGAADYAELRRCIAKGRKGWHRLRRFSQIHPQSKKRVPQITQIHPVLLQAKEPARTCGYFLSVEILMLLSRRPGMSVGAICATGLYRSDPSFVLEEIKG